MPFVDRRVVRGTAQPCRDLTVVLCLAVRCAEDVGSVIFATGYRPNLAYLAPLGALDAEGRALHRHGASLTVPGLYFMGLSNQRTFASATLRGVGPDAAVVVRQLTRHLAPAKRAFILTGLRLAATQICCPTR